MPPRKEPKEQVVYPSSRTKTPAFKPLRRIPTRESQPSVPTKATAKTKIASSKAPTISKSKRPIVLPDSEQEEEDSDDDLTLSTNKIASTSKLSGDGEEENEEEEEEQEPHKKTTTTTTSAAPKRKASAISSLDSSTDHHHHHHQQPRPTSPDKEPPPALTTTTTTTTSIPSIPQTLLLRLLHEAFHHKDTKIDTRALGMVQQYVEIFVREMIARCVAEKKEKEKEKKEKGEGGEEEEEMMVDEDEDDDDVGWLDLEDLEKVGVGMMMDF